MEKRHIALYKYLVKNGDKWVSQAQVARELYGYFGNRECIMSQDEYHDTTERRILTKTISDINRMEGFDKVIISSAKGIKLANEEEFYRYIKGQYKAVFSKLKRVRTMHKKANMHEQIDIDGECVDAFICKFN